MATASEAYRTGPGRSRSVAQRNVRAHTLAEAAWADLVARQLGAARGWPVTIAPNPASTGSDGAWKRSGANCKADTLTVGLYRPGEEKKLELKGGGYYATSGVSRVACTRLNKYAAAAHTCLEFHDPEGFTLFSELGVRRLQATTPAPWTSRYGTTLGGDGTVYTYTRRDVETWGAPYVERFAWREDLKKEAARLNMRERR